jgi:hypothetical protein
MADAAATGGAKPLCNYKHDADVWDNMLHLKLSMADLMARLK